MLETLKPGNFLLIERLIPTPGDPCSGNTEMPGWGYRIIFMARGGSPGNSNSHGTENQLSARPSSNY